jgi:hypothetical protein
MPLVVFKQPITKYVGTHMQTMVMVKGVKEESGGKFVMPNID